MKNRDEDAEEGGGKKNEEKKKRKRKKWRRQLSSVVRFEKPSRRPSNRSARWIKKKKIFPDAGTSRRSEIRICSQGRWFEEKRAGSLEAWRAITSLLDEEMKVNECN